MYLLHPLASRINILFLDSETTVWVRTCHCCKTGLSMQGGYILIHHGVSIGLLPDDIIFVLMGITWYKEGVSDRSGTGLASSTIQDALAVP